MISKGFASQTDVDRYLRKLRSGLRRLPPEQAEDIVDEIRSHINDTCQLSGGMDRARVSGILTRLGNPTALAATYLSENLPAPAISRRSPRWLLRSAIRWVGLGAAGLFGFFAILIGYALAGAFGVCALSKPFSPGGAGLWQVGGDDFTLQLGIGGPPPTPGAHELLGWWIIPLGLGAAILLILLTTEFLRFGIRAFQRERPRWSSGQFVAPPPFYTGD